MPDPAARPEKARAGFAGGANIAIKVPTHHYDETVAFYRDRLGLAVIAEKLPDICFAFGSCQWWIDRVDALSQAEIWLEVTTDDVAGAADLLASHGIARRDEIEPLPKGFAGLWVASPANIIHLVKAAGRSETA